MIYAETRVPLTEEEKDIVGRVCVNCGATEEIEYHHIIPLSLGGNDVLCSHARDWTELAQQANALDFSAAQNSPL